MSDTFPAPTGQRPIRTDGEPRRSVILASTGGAQHLERALRLLAPMTREHGAELLVAFTEFDDANGESEDALRRTFPQALFLRLPPNLPMEDVRRAGLDRCDGDIVRFVEAGSAFERFRIDALFSAALDTDGSSDP